MNCRRFKQLDIITLSFLFCMLSKTIIAQKSPDIKFGKVGPADFDLSNQKYDSGAAAIVIADIGECHYEGASPRYVTLFSSHHKRVKILKHTGFDIATVVIPLFPHQLIDIKANTYNLENGEVITTKLDGKSIFTENYSKGIELKKFTFPALKEGSIIEYSYTLQTGLQINLQPWDFQGKYPCLWSEFTASIPDFFNYVILSQGYIPYYINTATLNTEFTFNVTHHRWAMKDVPALREEKFTTTIANHIAKIEFQLASIQYPRTPTQDVIGNWQKISEKLMSSEHFGADLNSNNGWMNDDLNTITNGCKNNSEKARKIYAFLRDHFTCTSHSQLKVDNNIKTVFKNKSGSDAEINLLLTAMLNHENIVSNPIILSTRSHGRTSEIYPLMDRYNYVICASNIDGTQYFLDASQPRLGFGHLPAYCYNGHARMISKDMMQPVFFDADSISEQKLTTVFINNDENQRAAINGNFKSDLGYFDSYDLREKLSNKTEKEFFKDIKLPYSSEIEIQHGGIDSLKQADFPITVHYDFYLKNAFIEDVVYFNPMMSDAYKENPFKATFRLYPVEMPSAKDETYLFNMEIPNGYVVDEMPKPAKVLLNETDGFFEYVIVKDENNIQLRSRIKLNKANFQPDDYSTLREFFAFIVKKQSEQIVFKKKK